MCLLNELVCVCVCVYYIYINFSVLISNVLIIYIIHAKKGFGGPQ